MSSINQIDYKGTVYDICKPELDSKADKDSSIASAEQLLSSIYTPNTQPYLYRPTPADSDRERVKRIEGLSVGWNQLVQSDYKSASKTFASSDTYHWAHYNNISIPVSAGHKVLASAKITRSISGNDFLGLVLDDTTVTATILMLTIANGASNGNVYTIAEVPNNATAVTRISANNYLGKRGFDSGDSVGYDNLQIIDLTTLFGTTIADHIYTLEQATAGSGVAWVKQYIDLDSYHAYSAPTIKSVEGLEAHVMRDADDNIIGNYPLDSTITLRGIPKLVDGQLKADGDYYPPSGNVTVRYGVVDLGDLNWNKVQSGGNTFFQSEGLISTIKPPSDSSKVADCICPMFSFVAWNSGTVGDGIAAISGTSGSAGRISCQYHSLDSGTADDFKSAMSGVKLVYPLATPTTSTASPYSEVQICDGNGTEEFVTDSVVPVGNVTEYTADLRRQVENIYGIPKPPTTNGTYKLALTVSGGTPTYSWVSDS